MTVSVSLGEEIIEDIEVGPNPFTPNGDGVNDAAEIGFTVLKINVPREVRVEIYTLAGKKIWETTEARTNTSGRYSITWTGSNEDGRRVPPGFYLCRIEVDTDAARAIHRTICVAY